MRFRAARLLRQAANRLDPPKRVQIQFSAADFLAGSRELWVDTLMREHRRRPKPQDFV